MSEKENLEKNYLVYVIGCDEIKVSIDKMGQENISAVGCSKTLQLIKEYKQSGGKIASWKIPEGVSHSELLLKELILKVRNEWDYPYQASELCHCRAVPTEKVDQAILCGAHDIKSIQKSTSASTACGTCRDDVLKILKYRTTFSR